MNSIPPLNLRSSVPSVANPRKVIVPIATALAWGNDPAYIIQEKLDGRFETRQVSGTTGELGDTLLAGEYVRGEFYAFDVLKLTGEDCRHWPLRDRLAGLDGVFGCEPMDCTGGIIRRVQSADDGGKFLAEVLARGGEGVVRKCLYSPWGTPMEACKRLETFTCIVTGFNAGQSVQISLINRGDAETPSSETDTPLRLSASAVNACGSVKLGGGKCDRVRVGSILKIEGFGLTREGKIREPRPCKDSPTSWLVKY